MSAFRRRITITLFLSMIVACHRKVEMCARCHMAITPGDLHAADIRWSDGSHSKFDSAMCATYMWQMANPPGLTPNEMSVHEYYSGALVDASTIVFVQQSDVRGPMGDEDIAVDPSNVKKFQTDHGGNAFKLSDITMPHEKGLER